MAALHFRVKLRRFFYNLIVFATFFSTPAAGFFLIAEIVAVPVRVEAKSL